MIDNKKTIKEIEDQINKEINNANSLKSKYPYLNSETDNVITELRNQLRHVNELSNIPTYEGPEYNLIDKDKDDLSVAKSKIIAQAEWIRANSKEDDQQ